MPVDQPFRQILIGKPILTHNGPSTLLATVHAQPAHNRRVVHLLHYVPERRGKEMDIIEDRLPLADLRISLACASPISGVEMVPSMRPLPFRMDGDRIVFTVPRVDGHQLIAVHEQRSTRQ